uniref:Uncharacterized protein n=1 Tax=Oryza meridionalis TaxID=40149 RepID=A0A0E0F5C3_9ORYZ
MRRWFLACRFASQLAAAVAAAARPSSPPLAAAAGSHAARGTGAVPRADPEPRALPRANGEAVHRPTAIIAPPSILRRHWDSSPLAPFCTAANGALSTTTVEFWFALPPEPQPNTNRSVSTLDKPNVFTPVSSSPTPRLSAIPLDAWTCCRTRFVVPPPSPLCGASSVHAGVLTVGRRELGWLGRPRPNGRERGSWAGRPNRPAASPDLMGEKGEAGPAASLDLMGEKGELGRQGWEKGWVGFT